MTIIDIQELSQIVKGGEDSLIEQFVKIHETAKITKKVGIKNASADYGLAMQVDHEMFHLYSVYSIEDDGEEILIHRVR
ncbi:MAG: hypothetical protein ACRCXZ_00445 [Patescibacteria group bacterium]